MMGCLETSSRMIDDSNTYLTGKENIVQKEIQDKQKIGIDLSQEFNNISNLIINSVPSSIEKLFDKFANIAIIMVLIIQLRKAQTRGLGKIE